MKQLCKNNRVFYSLGNTDKDTMEDGVYDFLNDFQNADSHKIMMVHITDSFIFGNASKVKNRYLVVSGHTHRGQARISFKGGFRSMTKGF